MADDGADIEPSEAFSLVANDTRFGILETLWELTQDSEETPGFSTLHERSDVADSGQFNYHLDQLTPRFVRRVEEGYELTYAGRRVIGAAVSGVYTEGETASVAPMAVGTCRECGGTMEAGYGDGHITIECTDCEVVFTDLQAPPVLAAGYDPEDLPRIFSRRLVTDVQAMDRGFCRLCGGRIDPELDRSFGEAIDAEGDHLGVTWTCRACGQEVSGVVGMTVLDHPAVLAFHHERGIDLRETHLWELDWLFEPHGTVVDEEPLRVGITVPLDGEELRLELDGDLSVLDYERVENPSERPA